MICHGFNPRTNLFTSSVDNQVRTWQVSVRGFGSKNWGFRDGNSRLLGKNMKKLWILIIDRLHLHPCWCLYQSASNQPHGIILAIGDDGHDASLPN